MNEELFKSAVVMAAPLLAQAAHKAKSPLQKDVIHNYVVHAYEQLEKAQQTLRERPLPDPTQA